MLESGHSREAVLGYEVPYILGYMSKRVELMKERMPEKPSSPQRSKNRAGTRKVVKKMTGAEMLAKVRAQKTKEK